MKKNCVAKYQQTKLWHLNMMADRVMAAVTAAKLLWVCFYCGVRKGIFQLYDSLMTDLQKYL